MNVFPVLIFFLTILSPGCIIFVLKKLSLTEKVIFTPLISVVGNGLVYAVLRDFKILNFYVLTIYLTILLIIFVFIVHKEGRKETSSQLNWRNLRKFILKKKYLILIAIISLFLGISFYYSWFFPPNGYDALYYHLPIPQSVANGTYFDYLMQGGIQESAFKGVSTCYQMFYYPFFLLESNFYRIIPTLFGFILLLEILLFMKELNIKPKFAGLGLWLAILSPNILISSSMHYADLPVTCFFVGAVYFLYKHLTKKKEIYLYLGALVGGLGGLVKSTLFYFFVPLLVFEFLYYNWKHNVKLKNLKIPSYGKSLSLFLLTSSYYILRKIFLESNGPPWPAGSSELTWSVINNNLSHGILNFLIPSTHHAFSIVVILLTFISIYKFLARIKRKKTTDLIFLKIIFAGWIIGEILAAIFLYKSPALLRQLARFSMPIFPLALLFGIKDVETSFSGGGSEKSTLMKKAIIMILAFGALLLPLGHFILSHGNTNYVTSRYGEVTSDPLARKEKKLESIIGEEYLAWKYVNSHSDNMHEKVLTNEPRVFYLQNFAYTTRTETNPLSNISKRWSTENVSWAIIRKNNQNKTIENTIENKFIVKSKYNPKLLTDKKRISKSYQIFGRKIISKTYFESENRIRFKITVFGKVLINKNSFRSNWTAYYIEPLN